MLYRRAVQDNLVRGRSVEGVAGAALYGACRRCEVPWTLSEITEASRASKKEVAYTPLGIPLIAGPGSIASIMILYSETNGDINYKVHLFLALACVLLITLLIFRISKYLSKTFGKSGLRIMQRIMGLILLVISIQFIINGITPLLIN